MVDKTLILRKVAELSEYLDQIQEFRDISIKTYLSDWKTQRIVERTLQMMIEVCADIAGHIISDSAYRVPKTYSDAFRVLHENNILADKLSDKMERMAKFRNVVVHQYDKVDAEIVVGVLTRHLSDFDDYKDTILAFLREN
ncbi:MAG: DUF86 domain-containing protein [Kosmotogaceae bacterium]|nr:DUF86 domain-containing protein [Kosmotogaceae bacterium]